MKRKLNFIFLIFFFSSTSQLQPSLLLFLDLCNAQKMTKQQKHPNNCWDDYIAVLWSTKKGRKSWSTKRLIKNKHKNIFRVKKSATLFASSAITILTQTNSDFSRMYMNSRKNTAQCRYSVVQVYRVSLQAYDVHLRCKLQSVCVKFEKEGKRERKWIFRGFHLCAILETRCD